MAKVRPLIWFLAAATVFVVVITAHNHRKGKINIRALEWLTATSEVPDPDSEKGASVLTAERISWLAKKPRNSQPARITEEPLNQEEEQLKKRLKQEEDQQLKNLDMELKQIEGYMSEQRQNIENWYASNLANLQRWVEKRLKQLDAEERLAWARFHQNIKDTISNASGYATIDSYATADGYVTENSYARIDGYVTTNGYFSDTSHTFVVGDPAGRLKWEIRWIENSRKAAEAELVKLKRKREDYLADLESYGRRMRERVYREKSRIRATTKVKLAGGPGVVDAISYSDKEMPLIMFDGGIFYEGNIINGFKVHKIHRDFVEFEKNGQIWVQGL